MDYKALKCQILHGYIARRVLRRTLMIATAISLFPLLHVLSGGNPAFFAPANSENCAADSGNLGQLMLSGVSFFPTWMLVPIRGSFESFECKEDVNLTVNVVGELMSKHLLDYSAKVLCAGEGSSACVYALHELGFANTCGVYGHPFFSLKHKHLIYELSYDDNSFDFIFSRDLDKVSVPALLVLEIERVLKPGGIGAMLVGVSGSNPNSLIRSAMPVSSLLKASSVVHVGFMNDFSLGVMNDFTLVVFKKRVENVGFFGQYRLPDNCPSITKNKPFINLMEPLVEEKPMELEPKDAYLPKFVDVSLAKRMVYIVIGAGEHLNSAHVNWFLPSYPVDIRAFNIYFVDHNTSVLSSYVKKPGINFVYLPGLVGDKGTANLEHDPEFDPYIGSEGFDILAWFNETVKHADFVVMKMNTGELELKFLVELFESGAICSVNELFLHCSDPLQGIGEIKGGCMDLFKGLRSTGVFVHQWWGS